MGTVPNVEQSSSWTVMQMFIVVAGAAVAHPMSMFGHAMPTVSVKLVNSYGVPMTPLREIAEGAHVGAHAPFAPLFCPYRK